jgi:dihydropteroate synthase
MSTKPGAAEISSEEEMRRLKPALKMLMKYFPEAIISVDTYRSEIAKEVVEKYGAAIVNDISAGELDAEMFQTVASLKVPYIMMHIKGTPQTMQQNPQYEDIVQEIMLYFAKKLEQVKTLGVSDIIIDPGFGFGKTVAHNYELLKNLATLKILEKPILIGLSRKSMIYKVLETNAENALTGTIALNMAALLNGANFLRVHDVKEAVETVKVFQALNS